MGCLLECGDVAVVGSQAVVHRQQGHRGQGRQDPQSDHKVQLEGAELTEPEEDYDKKDSSEVYQEHQAREGQVSKVGSILEQLEEEHSEHQEDQGCEGHGEHGAWGLGLWWEVVCDRLVELVVFSDSHIGSLL